MLLKARNLTKSFGGVRAVAGVDIDVAVGEIVGIIGPNGAGKTSLLNMLSGIMRPDVGEVEFDGTRLTRLGPHRLTALGLARTFQNLGVFRTGTVLENILIGRHTRFRSNLLQAALGLPAAARDEGENAAKAREILSFLGVEHLAERRIDTLSYGLQKRIELGRVLAADPKLILVDELVSGMNYEETADISRLILTIRDKLGIAIAMIEHDVGMIMDLSDRIYVLNFGKLIASGNPVTVASHPDVIRAYIGSSDDTL